MTNYAQHFNPSQTPQSEKADARQVPNSAGGFTFTVDCWKRLERFLILGAEGGSYYIGASGENPTVRSLGEAASEAAGLGGRVAPTSVEDVHARLGEEFGDALLLSQQATGSLARIDLGWEPNGPTLVEELRAGSYVR